MLSLQDFAYVQQWMRQHAAVSLTEAQRHFVSARLVELTQRIGVAGSAELVYRLRCQPSAELVSQTVAALTVNETLFFRDQHPFDALRDQILPELIERRRSARSLRIWSAACSTGQEAYSVAMLLLAAFPTLAGWDVTIVGSDVSSEAVAKARAGRYTAFEMSRGLPDGYRERFFQPCGTEWEVSPALRRLVSFHVANLATSPGPGPACDLVLMRNVLIYFDTDTRTTVIDRVGRQLRPLGYLMVGGSESLLQPPSWSHPVAFGKTMCYQRREASSLSPTGNLPQIVS